MTLKNSGGERQGNGGPLLLGLVSGALFMQGLDSMMLITALPAIAADFGVAPIDLSVGVTSYLIAAAAVVPASGWIADRFGARAVLFIAICLFTLGSVACAFTSSVPAFVASRIIQGIGGALMVPVGRLAVLNGFSDDHLLSALNFITWPALLAPVIAPPLGGFITQYLSWQWIFLVNIPIGIVGAIMCLTVVPPSRRPEPVRSFDLVGYTLLAATLVLSLAGLEVLSTRQGQQVGLLALLAGVACGSLAYRHLRRHRAPIIDLKLFETASFTMATIGSGALFRIVLTASPFLFPLFLQLGLGLEPAAAGSFMLAYMGANLIMKMFTTRVLRRRGFRKVLWVNGLFVAASVAALSLTGLDNMWVLLCVLFVAGLSRSMQFTALAGLTFADIHADHKASANAIFSISQQVAQAVGVSLSAGLITAATMMRGGGEASAADLRFSLAIIGLLALAGIPGVFRLAADAGGRLTGHRGSNPAAADGTGKRMK